MAEPVRLSRPSRRLAVDGMGCAGATVAVLLLPWLALIVVKTSAQAVAQLSAHPASWAAQRALRDAEGTAILGSLLCVGFALMGAVVPSSHAAMALVDAVSKRSAALRWGPFGAGTLGVGVHCALVCCGEESLVTPEGILLAVEGAVVLGFVCASRRRTLALSLWSSPSPTRDGFCGAVQVAPEAEGLSPATEDRSALVLWALTMGDNVRVPWSRVVLEGGGAPATLAVRIGDAEAQLDLSGALVDARLQRTQNPTETDLEALRRRAPGAILDPMKTPLRELLVARFAAGETLWVHGAEEAEEVRVQGAGYRGARLPGRLRASPAGARTFVVSGEGGAPLREQLLRERRHYRVLAALLTVGVVFFLGCAVSLHRALPR